MKLWRLIIILLSICSITSSFSRPENQSIPATPTQSATLYLPLVLINLDTNLQPFYQWLSLQQDPSTGLFPSQEDDFASTYNNALAVMVLTLNGDHVKAKRTLNFFNSRADEFFKSDCLSFASPCAQIPPCGDNSPCGFFQFRNSTNGEPYSGINRWMGDNAWLLMAIHHYQQHSGDNSYEPMALALVKLLKSLQQPDGFIASGWENGDSIFNRTGHAEGNLDAYKALSLYSEAEAALQVKHWLDTTDLNWKKGPLDLHAWRVPSLGKGYGYVLPDTERTDDEAIRYKNTISDINSRTVTGFLPVPASEYLNQCKSNIWVEGTGQMVVAFYKAGYQAQGDFYAGELRKLVFEPPAFPGTKTLSFLALPDPVCYAWADITKGHIAAVSWYIFAQRRFDPFAGDRMDTFSLANPIQKLEAENFELTSSVKVRRDQTGTQSEGNGLHIGGDNEVLGDDSSWIEYKFNILVPINVRGIGAGYADDVGGDQISLYIDGKQLIDFNSSKTGSWDDYIEVEHLVPPFLLQPGLHTFRIEVADQGTWGLTADYFYLLSSE